MFFDQGIIHLENQLSSFPMLHSSLLTEGFLIEGITEYPEWKNVRDKEVEALRESLIEVFYKFPVTGSNVIEATTEMDLIEPVLRALGWSHYLKQQTTARKGREDVP
ncbi:MAG: hypothetical protein IPH04_19785 [Saprospirales bacterium]|nr:hypothetical protein [Saprospirales bacterium]